MPLQYPENLDWKKDDHTMMRFTLFKRPKSTESTLDEMIYLYMPENLQNNTNTQWEQANVGRTARELKDKGFSGTLDSASGAMSDKLSQLLHQGKNMLGGGESRAEYVTGEVLNPYIAMTFKGLGFRQFELTFKFTPHTEPESETIKEIISKFREASLPSLKGNLFTYPMEIDVAYMGLGAKWLFKYKRCVLTAVDVNYTSVGFYASLKNGMPAQTEMTLRFSENELITAEDVKYVAGEESY